MGCRPQIACAPVLYPFYIRLIPVLYPLYIRYTPACGPVRTKAGYMQTRRSAKGGAGWAEDRISLAFLGPLVQ